MNPVRKEGWVLCKSTRIPGKFYYFNVHTGEAAWSINEIERGMTTRPTFAPKWHSYVTPVSPPEENVWNYQPAQPFQAISRSLPAFQSMSTFGQAPFPKYMPTMFEMPHTNMVWPVPMSSSMYVMPQMMEQPMMNPPIFEPSWSGNGSRVKIPDKNPFQRCHEVPFNLSRSFDQPQNRPVMAQKSNNLKRNINMNIVKQPLIKKSRLHLNETFIPNNLSSNNIFKNSSSEDSPKQKIKCKHTCTTCHGKFTKSQDKASSWPSNSWEDRTAINQERYQKNTVEYFAQSNAFCKTTELSKSMKKLDVAHSDNSSSSSFVFPLKKADSKESNKSCDYRSKLDVVKNINNFEAGKSFNNVPSNKISQDRGQEDLRDVLLARKRSNNEKCDAQANTGRKIKTYKESQAKESGPKKQVTFDLGVEGSSVGGEGNYQNPSMQDPEDENDVDDSAKEPCFVVTDLDVLLTDFQLVEDYVKSEQSHSLLMPLAMARAIERAGRGAGGGAGGSSRLASARRLARTLAQPPEYIVVQSKEVETEASSTMDPALACCWQMIEQGYCVVFITNNAELYNNATELKIECYTTREVKEYLEKPKPEISFDFKRVVNLEPDNFHAYDISSKKCVNTNMETDIPHKLVKKPGNTKDEDMPNTIPVNAYNTKVFGNLNNQEKITFDNDELTKKKFSVTNSKFMKNNTENDAGNFLDYASLINRDIKHCSKFENFEIRKQVTEEKENILFNSDEATQMDHTAKKKNKNINIYNLNELMKDFTVKTREIEDRILCRIEEYVCSFSQIMEDTLLDIFEDTPYEEDHSRSPLQNLLISLRESHSDQRERTIKELAEKLNTALDCLYGPKSNGVTIRLDLLRPYEFMKILGYGSLLIKCLLNNDPENVRLQESDELLCSLLSGIETGLDQQCSFTSGIESGVEPAEPRTASPLRSPVSPHPPRSNFVNNQSEVLRYLEKHYPEWKSVKNPGDHQTENTKENHEPKNKEKSSPKIIRTLGKNLSHLKFSSGKKMVLNTHNDNKLEENTKDNISSKETTAKKDVKKITGPKLVRKLTLESSNLPPKMKEIDIEKREKVNKDILNMIDEMIAKNTTEPKFIRKLTLESSNVPLKLRKIDDKKIEENKNSKQITKYYDLENIIIKNSNAKFSSSDTNVSKSNSVDEVKNTEDKNGLGTSEPKTKEPLDLDILDYSDNMEESCEEKNLGSEGTNKELVPVDNSRDHSDMDGQEKELKNESIDDPVLWKQGYSLIQVFLISLSKTFNTLLKFIRDSVAALRSADLPEAKRTCWYEKAVFAETAVSDLIDNLNGIMSRESNDETALVPLVLKLGSPAHQDERIVQYKKVVMKCVEQAQILASSIQLIKKMCQGD